MTSSTDDAPSSIPKEAADAFDAGTLAFVNGDNEPAAEALARAVSHHPDFPEAYYVLALTRLRLGEREAGVEALRKVVDTSENALLRDYAAVKLKGLDA